MSTSLSLSVFIGYRWYLEFRLMEGIQDSLGFWIPHPGFRIPGTGFQSLSVEVAFRLPIVSNIPDSLSCILDYKTPNSGFYEQEFPGYRIPWARISRIPDSTGKNFPDSRIRIPLHLGDEVSDPFCNSCKKSKHCTLPPSPPPTPPPPHPHPFLLS